MFNKRTTLAVSAGLTVAVCSTALAGNPFRGLTTTEGGYHTWDSDLINVEAVSQTGHGVYVAVLDTGIDRKSTRLNSSHCEASRMPSSA